MNTANWKLFTTQHYCYTTRLTADCPGLPGWAGTRKVKPIWILLKQETVGGNGISWAVCKSAPRSRQITMPAPHPSDLFCTGCPFCRPTNSVKALKAVHYVSNWLQLLCATFQTAGLYKGMLMTKPWPTQSSLQLGITQTELYNSYEMSVGNSGILRILPNSQHPTTLSKLISQRWVGRVARVKHNSHQCRAMGKMRNWGR